MERDNEPPKQHHNHNQNPSSSSHQNPKEISLPESSQKNIANANDRLKRDEWSEGAVSTLLEAYEAKWTLRNRAKLKGQDWEEVAKHVSARGRGAKSSKTQTQCKNKIESMKKRYRSESSAPDPSSWPLYRRLDLLLRGNAGAPSSNPPPTLLMVVDSPSVLPPVADCAMVMELGSPGQINSHGENDGEPLAKEEGRDETNNGTKSRKQESEKNPIDETDSSTPPPIDHFQKEKPKTKLGGLKKIRKMMMGERKDEKSMKRGREEYWEIGESIRWVAEVVVRSEEARMETMREIERMRAEADAKRAEMDLKRTEIIANTQLQIAKLFARGSVDDNWKKPT